MDTKQTQHTKTPWGVFPDEWTNKRTAIIAAPQAKGENRIIACVGFDREDGTETTSPVADYADLDETDMANAEYIVRACNNFEALRVALKRMLSAYEFGYLTYTEGDHDIVAPIIRNARAAIAEEERCA